MSDEKVTVVTPIGRLAFTRYLFSPEDAINGDKYSCAIIIDPAKNVDKIKKLLSDTGNEFFNNKIPADAIFPMKKAPQATADKFEYTKDMLILNVSTKFPISVIDRNNDEILEGGIKAGDHVRFAISAFGYNNPKGKKGVGCNPVGIQLISEGEAFASRQSSADIFGDSKISDADLANFGLTGGEETSAKSSGSDDPFGF